MASTLIHSVRIFSGEEVISQNGYVLLQDGLIKNISASTPSDVPKADITIDGAGHTVLPGLIDGHVHAHDGLPELEQALKFGVTTVLDMFHDSAHAYGLKQACKNRSDLADFKSANYGATVDGGWPEPVFRATMPDLELANAMIARWPKLQSPKDADAFVQKNIEDGADYIKLVQESGSVMHGPPLPVPSSEIQAAVVSAAHKHGKIAVAHALSQEATMIVLGAGVDGLAHCFADEPPNEALVVAYRKNNSFLIPTLVVASTLTGEEVASSEKHVAHPFVGKVLDEEGKTCFCKKMMLAKGNAKVEFAYETVRMLKKAGFDIIAGTDTATGLGGVSFGLSLHQELSLYTERCGFTPIEALKSATSTTARRFNLVDRGLLKEGLRADILFVEGDPTLDIAHTLNVAGVWRGGEALKL